jgi:hypothetical protein
VNFSTVTDDAIVANIQLSEHEADHTCWTKLGTADDLVRRGNVKWIYKRRKALPSNAQRGGVPFIPDACGICHPADKSAHATQRSEALMCIWGPPMKNMAELNGISPCKLRLAALCP